MRLRIRLAAICAVTAALPLVAISILIVRQAAASARNGRMEKLQAESRAAESVYEKRLIEMRSAAQGLADEIAGRSLLESGETGRNPGSGAARARLQDFLATSRDALSLDFLIVAQADGQVFARHNDLPKPGETLVGSSGRNPLAEEVIGAGSRLRVTSLAESVIEQGEFLSRMWLDKPATIPNRPGTRALIVESAAPVMSSGRFLGVVLAGQMVNNSHKSRQPVSNPLRTPIVTEGRLKLYPGVDQGAGVLVALGDTVIASSVFQGAPSEPVLVGSKHDPSRALEILASGEQDYAVSWRPVKSMEGAEIGAIGAAISAGGQSAMDVSLISTLALATAGTALLVGLAGAFWAGSVSRRLAVLSDAVSRMRVGE